MDENQQINCEIAPGEELRLGDPRIAKCKFKPGSSFFIAGTDENSDTDIADTQTVAGQKDPAGSADMLVVQAQVQQVPAAVPAAAPIAAVPSAVAPAAGVPITGAPAPTQATVAQAPIDPATQLTQLAASGQNISPMTLVMGALVVLGGGTAWKFYSQKSKQGFELKMQEMENQKNGNEEQKKQCQAAAVACGASTASLTARLEDLSRQMSQMKDSMESLSKKVSSAEEASIKAGKMGSGLEDLEERLESMEKKMKRLTKRDSD